MSKIEKINVHNFKGIENISSELSGSSVYVTGGNGAGKSSFIDAVFTTLTGKNIPPEPIKRGETESSIEIEFDSFVAIMEYKKRRGSDDITQKLTIVNRESGQVIDKPRTWLNSIVGIIDFDAAEFFGLSANKQVEYICKVLEIPIGDIDKKYAELYEERTFRNRELNRLKDSPRVHDPKIADWPPVNVADLHEKIKGANEINAVRTNADRRLSELQQQAETLRAQLAETESKIATGKDYISKLPAAVDPEYIKDLETQIINADAVNAEIRSHIVARETDIAYQNAEKDVAEIAKEIKAVIDQKKKILSDSIKIPGLEFDGEQFLFNGLPFAGTQINTAEQLVAALQIGRALLKDVNILRVDGSLFDNENLNRVNAWAAENGVQLFAEIVDRAGGALTVEIVENVG